MFKRYLYKIIYPIARFYWFLFRPQSQGVKCVIEHNGNVLMIRNAYTRINQWTFPGGGVKKNESPEDAIKREVAEETGINVLELNKLGQFFTTQEYKEDRVHCFYATTKDMETTKDHAEIQEIKWFPVNEIPNSIAPSVTKVLKLFRESNMSM